MTHSSIVRSLVLGLLCFGASACSDSAPSGPTPTIATVQIVFLGATSRRADLTADQIQGCADAIGSTHVHPSWRGNVDAFLNPVGADRYQLTFDDVPVGQEVTFSIWDQNWCDQSQVGSVLRNVSANGVALTQNVGTALGPGFSFTVDGSGRVRQ